MGTRTVRVQITVQLGEGLIKAVARQRLQDAFDNGRMEAIVRRVLSETLLKAYRKKVLQLLPLLLSPEIKKLGNEFAKTTQESFLAAIERRDKAIANNNTARAQDAAKEITRIKQRVDRRLARNRPLATGQYRKRLMQVLDSLTDPANLNVYTKGGAIGWQVGNTKLLKNILIPSFRDKGSQTSKYYSGALMWKQLVYGAGVYSTDPGPSRPAKKDGWTFMRFFKIKGIRGVNLRVEYENDALGYKRKIMQAITGEV